MCKALYKFGWIVFLLSACSNREAEIPVYITVNNFRVNTDFPNQGSASSRVTTIWAVLDGKDIGAYELPVTFPLLAKGKQKLEIIPGINLNGAQAIRNQYEFYRPFEITTDFVPGTEITLSTGSNDFPVTSYEPWTTIVRLEDFEGAGLNFAPTQKSDTSVIITTDPTEIFSEAGLTEENKRSGKIVVPKGNSIVEFKSINAYVLPKFSSNVYLEVNFKCDLPVTFGIFANEPLQSLQRPVVTVNPTNGEWRKIYINLVSEVSAFPNATNYHIFYGATNGDPSSRKLIYIDNMKLVY
jgi:hypothetical protein